MRGKWRKCSPHWEASRSSHAASNTRSLHPIPRPAPATMLFQTIRDVGVPGLKQQQGGQYAAQTSIAVLERVDFQKNGCKWVCLWFFQRKRCYTNNPCNLTNAVIASEAINTMQTVFYKTNAGYTIASQIAQCD